MLFGVFYLVLTVMFWSLFGVFERQVRSIDVSSFLSAVSTFTLKLDLPHDISKVLFKQCSSNEFYRSFALCGAVFVYG